MSGAASLASRRRRGLLPLPLSLSLTVGACGDDPMRPERPAHPIVGTYDLRTSLVTHMYVVLCTTPPITSPYCPVTEPAGAASLTGTLVIGDTVVLVDGGRRALLPDVGARLDAYPCEQGPPACDPATKRGTLLFVGGTDPSSYGTPVLLAPDTLRAQLGYGTGTSYLSLRGRHAGDSIAGTVDWATSPGRAWYQGTFVATRRR